MREVCTTWPGGFVAHHYTRYLGDLSGGQHVAGVVRRVLAMDDSSGTSFHTFADIPDAGAFKAEYRRRLDEAPWDEDERDRVVDEIRIAYHHNTRVLAMLG